MATVTDERRLLGLLGLGVRGRRVVVGVDRVREAARRGSLRVAVVAEDASRHSRDKVVRLLRAKGVPMIGLPAATLGQVVGRATTAVVGVEDRALAEGILALVDPTGEGPNGSRRTG
jgi:ribosomal protein L7Ae-like RNA K-turn-binding protein